MAGSNLSSPACSGAEFRSTTTLVTLISALASPSSRINTEIRSVRFSANRTRSPVGWNRIATTIRHVLKARRV